MKRESSIINFIKGFIIGLGIIFPISASGLAVSMGLYEKLLNIINNLKQQLKNDLSFIISFVIGVIISIIISCVLVNYTYKIFPVATLLFFEGLIMGGLPLIFNKVNKDYKFVNILWMILGVLLLIGISFMGTSGNAVLTTSFGGLCKIFFVGMLAAGTMIIPGVSGSLILVILGFYQPMLDIITNIVKFKDLFVNIEIAFVFGIGMILGIIIVSKLMDYFLKHFERKTYFVIIGFIIASIINVLILIIGYKVKLIELIIGIILMILGYLISFKFLKE